MTLTVAQVQKEVGKIGSLSHLSGYRPLLRAITMAGNSPGVKLGAIYRELAKDYDTSPIVIEKNIRYAVGRALLECPSETRKELFGDRNISTNSQFIFELSEHIRLEEESVV